MADQHPMQLLKDHSLRFIEMALSTDHIERIENPDGYGRRSGECGDTIEFFLCQTNGRLTTVSFSADGCLHTVACGNSVVRLTQKKSVARAWQLQPDDIIRFLETLPEDHHHCAELSAGAFYLALKDLERRKA